jgi:hypothetical protein
MGPTRLLAAALLHMRQPWHPLTIHLRSTCHPQSLDQNQETKTPTLRQPPPTVYSALTRLAPSPIMVSLFFVFVVCFFSLPHHSPVESWLSYTSADGPNILESFAVIRSAESWRKILDTNFV